MKNSKSNYFLRQFPKTRPFTYHLDKKKCTECMDCEAVCPAGAINIITHPEFTDQQVANDRDLQKQHGYKYNNFYKFYIDFSKCVHCQACVKICESKALSVQEGEVLPVLEKKKLKRDLLSSK